jgi:hypothetical protein
LRRHANRGQLVEIHSLRASHAECAEAQHLGLGAPRQLAGVG